MLHDGPHPTSLPVPFDVDGVRRRLARLREQVAAKADGRPVTIVAVTKGFGPDVVAAAAAAGVHDMGESYGHELLAKATVADAPVRWHFLGAVQRRKVRALAPHVHMWQSLDRDAAAGEIARHAPGSAVLVQVNVTGAEGRNGCTWAEAPGLVERCRGLSLDVRGLMAVAGRDDPRPHFHRLAGLASQLELAELSMGMSDDFGVAIEEGATIIRVGRGLFGDRPVPSHEGRRR